MEWKKCFKRYSLHNIYLHSTNFQNNVIICMSLICRMRNFIPKQDPKKDNIYPHIYQNPHVQRLGKIVGCFCYSNLCLSGPNDISVHSEPGVMAGYDSSDLGLWFLYLYRQNIYTPHAMTSFTSSIFWFLSIL
jgi:hypothetical protein